MLPLISWKLVKDSLAHHYKLKTSDKEFNRLKFNHQIFESLLNAQKNVGLVSPNLGLVFGDPNAKNTVIKVCNPYCGPCAKVHPQVEKILEDHKDSMRLQIIFSVSDDENDIRSLPVQHLLAIYNQNDEMLTKKALDDWYGAEIKDYDAFKSKYPIKIDLDKVNKQLLDMAMWSTENDIRFTPTFFINGYQLPEMYSVKDIPYFIEN